MDSAVRAALLEQEEPIPIVKPNADCTEFAIFKLGGVSPERIPALHKAVDVLSPAFHVVGDPRGRERRVRFRLVELLKSKTPEDGDHDEYRVELKVVTEIRYQYGESEKDMRDGVYRPGLRVMKAIFRALAIFPEQEPIPDGEDLLSMYE